MQKKHENMNGWKDSVNNKNSQKVKQAYGIRLGQVEIPFDLGLQNNPL